MPITQTLKGKNQERLNSLLRLVETDILHWAATFSGPGTSVAFHVKVSPTANTKIMTGSQVDAFLYGVRVGSRAGE